MKIDVVEKNENPLLKRTDLILTVDHTGQATPKKDELIKEISEKFSSVPENVEIIYIYTESGLAKSKVKAKIWKEKPPEKKVKKKEEKLKVEKELIEEKPKEKKEEKVEERPTEKKEEKVEKKPTEKKEGEKSET